MRMWDRGRGCVGVEISEHFLLRVFLPTRSSVVRPEAAYDFGILT